MSARAVLGLLLALGGCASAPSYPVDPGGNVTVRTRLEAGVDAAVHVHRMGQGCTREYRGVVRLDERATTIDLPVGQAAYLVVGFDTSSLFSGSRHTSYGTLIEPRAGYRYELDVRYKEGIYAVELTEREQRTSAGRALPRREPPACKA